MAFLKEGKTNWKYILIITVSAFIVGGGILAWQYWPPKEDTNITPLEKGGYPKLDSVLYQLIQAKDYNKFGQTHDLNVTDNKVRVIIELINSEYVLPINFGTEEARYENLLQAVVPIDKLLDLADDPNIKFIRRPIEPIPGQGEIKVEEKETTEKEILEMKERDSKRSMDLRQIIVALEIYYDSYGSYPILEDTSQDGEFLKVLVDKGYFGDISPTFLDPLHPDYFYEYQGSATSYTLKCYAEEEGGVLDMNDGKKDHAYTKVVK